MAFRLAISSVQNRAFRQPWPLECWTPETLRAPRLQFLGCLQGCTPAFQHHTRLPHEVQSRALRTDHAPSQLCAQLRKFTCRRSSSLGVVSPAPLNLNDIVVLESVQKLSRESIAHVWNSFYADKSAEVSWTLQGDQWHKVRHRMKENKISVLPLHKEPDPAQASQASFISILCQVQMPKSILMTPLALYQQHAADARPCIIATVYEELTDSNDIVLGRADILDGAFMSKAEAMKLVDDLLLCYMDDMLYQHISLLNQSNPDFDYDVFIHKLLQHQTTFTAG